MSGVRLHTFADGTTDRLGSEPEELLAWQLRAVGIPFQREFRFAPPRKWRADFIISLRLLVEVDGGSWTGGRHTSGAGFEKDCEKQSAAAIAGYRVIRVTPAMVEDGRALKWIEAAR